MRHWLMKTEPETFSIADLERVKLEPWTGVRSRMARNQMRAMAIGDRVLIYHSSCEPPGVAGIARVARTGVVDPTQFDPTSPYFDASSLQEAPIWDCVEVEYEATLPHFVSLGRLRVEPHLSDMMLFNWTRLSVQPVGDAQFDHIVAMAQVDAPEPPKPRPKPKKKKTVKAKATRTGARRGRPARRRRARRRRDRGNRCRPCR